MSEFRRVPISETAYRALWEEHGVDLVPCSSVTDMGPSGRRARWRAFGSLVLCTD